MSKDAARPPHFRRNFVALVVYRAFSSVAFSVVGRTSVMPAFVRRLTTSAPLVGLVGTVSNGGMLLPQALVAHTISSWPRKKPPPTTA